MCIRDRAISLFDVAKTLTSTSISLCPPTGVTFLSCNTLSNFACKDRGISEISSKSNVPLSAARKIPLFAFDAPVKAPLKVLLLVHQMQIKVFSELQIREHYS